jgi:hypothetical protein
LEKVIVSYTNLVQIYFDDLIDQLFCQDYFTYRENAIDYVEKLVFYINDSIHQLPHKNPRNHFRNMAIFIFSTIPIQERLGIFSSPKNGRLI